MSAKTADPFANLDRRKVLLRATTVAGGLGLAVAAYPFFRNLAPSERALALGGPVEVEISGLAAGQLATIEWRGKPVWVLRRTPEMLAGLEKLQAELADANSSVTSQQPRYARNSTRSIRRDMLVTVALCTHLGCVPSYRPDPGSVGADWPGGFYCPCHGSKFDLAGRVFKGSPAPINLLVPPHRFVSAERLVVGSDDEGKA